MKVPPLLYASPALRYDALAQVVVIENRNPETGEVTSQLPTEESVKRARLAALAGTAPGEAAPQEGGQAAPDPASAQPPVSLVV